MRSERLAHLEMTSNAAILPRLDAGRDSLRLHRLRRRYPALLANAITVPAASGVVAALLAITVILAFDALLAVLLATGSHPLLGGVVVLIGIGFATFLCLAPEKQKG